MPSRVQVMHHIIAQHRQLGLNPCEIHANTETVASFIHEAGLTSRPDRRSLLEKLRDGIKSSDLKFDFDGVLLVANDKVPGGNIILRPLALMSDPNWLDHVQMAQGGLQKPPADGSTPWHEKAAHAKADDADGDVLEMLQSAGGTSATQVLIKAMEGMDSVTDVVVLRFHRGGDVEMCATMDRWRVMGALQDALAYVMRNGD